MKAASCMDTEIQITWRNILSEEEFAEGEGAQKAKGVYGCSPWVQFS